MTIFLLIFSVLECEGFEFQVFKAFTGRQWMLWHLVKALSPQAFTPKRSDYQQFKHRMWRGECFFGEINIVYARARWVGMSPICRPCECFTTQAFTTRCRGFTTRRVGFTSRRVEKTTRRVGKNSPGTLKGKPPERGERFVCISFCRITFTCLINNLNFGGCETYWLLGYGRFAPRIMRL